MRVVEWKSSHRDDVRVFTFTHLFMLMYSHLKWLTLHSIRDAECLSWLVQSSSQIWRGLQHVNFIEDFISIFELSYWWKFQTFHPHTLKFSHFASNMSNHHDNDNFCSAHQNLYSHFSFTSLKLFDMAHYVWPERKKFNINRVRWDCLENFSRTFRLYSCEAETGGMIIFIFLH